MKNKNIFLLYECDAWKSDSSMILLMATTKREVLHRQIVEELEQSTVSEDSAPYTYRGLTGTPAARVFKKEWDYDDLQYLHVVEAEDGELLEERS